MDVQAFFSQLDQLYAAGDRKVIESFLQQALREAQQEEGSAEISVLNELMGFYRNTGRMEEAIFHTEQALMKTRALGLTESAGWGTTLLNAATAYRAAGNNEYALELYRETEAVYRKYLPEGDARCAAVYNNMSDLYAEKGDSAAAAELLLRALDIVKSLEGTAVEQAIIRGNLANIYAAMERDEDALVELTAALSIYEEQKSPDGKKDPHYAAALAALAMCRQREGRYKEAVELYEQTLEEIQIHYGKNQNYYLTCRNIAQVYLAMGEKEKAAQYLSIADGAPLKDGRQP